MTIEPGDVEEGMRAAEAIGDDTLQRQAQGVVVPESFTHGTSAQRMEALRRGMQTGNPGSCTYSDPHLAEVAIAAAVGGRIRRS